MLGKNNRIGKEKRGRCMLGGNKIYKVARLLGGQLG